MKIEHINKNWTAARLGGSMHGFMKVELGLTRQVSAMSTH